MNYELIKTITKDAKDVYDIHYTLPENTEIDKETEDFLNKIHCTITNRVIRPADEWYDFGKDQKFTLTLEKKRWSLVSKNNPVRTGFVFDENKSVKWNREQVEKHNNFVKSIKELQRQLAELIENSIRAYYLGIHKDEYYYQEVWNRAYMEDQVRHMCLQLTDVANTYYNLLEWLKTLESLKGKREPLKFQKAKEEVDTSTRA